MPEPQLPMPDGYPELADRIADEQDLPIAEAYWAAAQQLGAIGGPPSEISTERIGGNGLRVRWKKDGIRRSQRFRDQDSADVLLDRLYAAEEALKEDQQS